MRRSLPQTRLRRSLRKAGFTLTEIYFAVGITALVVGAFLIFWEGTSRTLVSIVSQTSHNQIAGTGIEFIISRIRLANTVSTNAAGSVLTLSFDDDPEVDSNGDATTWNDRDHYEQFIYYDPDQDPNSTFDNYIIYKADTNVKAGVILIPNSVRYLSGAPIFGVDDDKMVSITFGLLTTNATQFSQAIEIRTKAALRNRIE